MKPQRIGLSIGITLVCGLVASCGSNNSSDSKREAGAIQISEIHYKPLAELQIDQFIEITNSSSSEVQIQDWCIKGVGFCFSDPQLIKPGEFVAIFASAFQGKLSESGETLQIIDPLEQVIDEVSYSQDSPWPPEANGGGFSLHRANPTANGNRSWVASVPTPNESLNENYAAKREVVVTEINYNPENSNPAEAFVEVFNATENLIDLENWCISGVGYCWSQSTPVQPGASVVANGWGADKSLSRSGESIVLIDDAKSIQDFVQYSDTGPWPALADGHGYTLNRRDPTETGTSPANWDAFPPTPGQYVPKLNQGLLPILHDLTYTKLPAAMAPIAISAVVENVTSIDVNYTVGFSDESVISNIPIVDGKISLEIPGQPAGSLVRFRFTATNQSTTGTWPRQGDGSKYLGTVVDSTAASQLPKFNLFIPDDVYSLIRNDYAAHGNDGYPIVFAYKGEIFDNSLMRMKGNQARGNSKKKWKIMLPAGHEWDVEGRLNYTIDQFELLPAATDKSFSRELLTYELQKLSGGFSQLVFPLRLEKNNEFFGLYMFGELIDGDWRDSNGFSEKTLVYKAERNAKMNLGTLELPSDQWPLYYERESLTYIDDNDELLRQTILDLNELEGEELRNYAYQHIDIPQVIEAIATMRLAQHPEWQHKNYLIMYDYADAKWRLVPIDFDLNFGKWFHSPCNARCDEVRALPMMNYPDEQRIAAVILDDPIFREMVDTRTRTLADKFYAEGYIENRLAEFFKLMGPDAALDRGTYSSYGEEQSMDRAQQILVDQFLVPKRQMMQRDLPPSPSTVADITVEVVTREGSKPTSVVVTNSGDTYVDVSGRTFADIGMILPVGLVIPPKSSVDVVFSKSPVVPGLVPRLSVLGKYVLTDGN